MSISFEPMSTKYSIKNAYALALCSELAYGSEKKISEALSGYGFSVRFIERRDTQAFIAYNESAVVLAFRGTTNIRDWMTNSDISLISFGQSAGKVHSGFLHALYLVWDDILQVINSVQNNAQPFWITGHSLGGALATLAAARFAFELDKPIRGVYTFGQPRTVDREFGRVFDTELKSRFFRFVNNHDIVTRVPTREMNYSHVGSLRFIDSDGDIHDDTSWWQEFLESVKGTFNQQLDLIPSNLENHKISLYVKKIKSNLPG